MIMHMIVGIAKPAEQHHLAYVLFKISLRSKPACKMQTNLEHSRPKQEIMNNCLLRHPLYLRNYAKQPKAMQPIHTLSDRLLDGLGITPNGLHQLLLSHEVCHHLA